MKLIPSRLQVAFEFVVSTLLNLCESIAGPKYGRQVFPIVATIFLFVFINAWTSLIPGYGSITIGVEHRAISIFRCCAAPIPISTCLWLWP